MASSSIQLDISRNFLVQSWREWRRPRSRDRDTAFRERTIRLVVGSGIILIALTLLTSLFVFRDPWELVSYPTLFALMLVIGIGSATAVSRANVLAAGWLLVVVWIVASIGVVVMGRGYAGTLGISVLMLALVCASVVLPRRAILPIGLICIVIAAGINQLSYAVGAIPDPTNVGPMGGILSNAILFIAEALFLRERVKESDDRLAAMQKLIVEAENARQEADAANRAKSQFLANMSHELRTPLNAVTGYTDIMLTGMVGDFTENQRELLTYIQSNGKRLLYLINDILDLSKIESGKVEVFLTLSSPRKVVSEVVDSMQSLAQKKNVFLKTVCDDDVPEAVLCDVPKVQQIVTNLVGNALKFTDQGGVSVEIGADGNFWQLRVRDTGIGMPDDAAEYIFEKFRQVDNEKTRTERGTGLGLAIVKSLIDRLGGTVKVQSKLGVGTVFIVSLPRHPNETGQAVTDETPIAKSVIEGTVHV
jgi:signal transduction histidine kinase